MIIAIYGMVLFGQCNLNARAVRFLRSPHFFFLVRVSILWVRTFVTAFLGSLLPNAIALPSWATYVSFRFLPIFSASVVLVLWTTEVVFRIILACDFVFTDVVKGFFGLSRGRSFWLLERAVQH